MFRYFIVISIFLSVSATAFAADRSVKRNQAQADSRVALVIGNSAYTNGALKNPVNDARDMAAALQGYGFAVTLKLNADQRAMEMAIDRFGRTLRGGGTGLFYFAGHGVQVNGTNYLIPIGANIDSEAVVKYEAVDANRVLSRMEDAGNRLNLAFLDACRDNPYARSFRSNKQGLAAMQAPAGSLVAFATAPGGVAADGSGRNGVFTRHLLDAMAQQDMEIGRLMRRVRSGVQQDTGGRQTPFEVSSLTGEFYFQGPSGQTEVASLRVEQRQPRNRPEAVYTPPVQVAEPSSYRSGDSWTEPVTGMEFVFVEGGCFQMGCGGNGQAALPIPVRSFADLPAWQWPLAVVAAVLPVGCASPTYNSTTGCYSNERPVHEVCLDSFWIGKYEVTQGQWTTIMGSNPSSFKKGNDYPVEKVSWHDAVEYVGHLSSRGGKTFRLPTEAQWEYAARSGGKSEKYSGSNSPDYVAWYDDNSNSTTHRVGSKQANGLGIHDMSGNVFEWCSDWFGENYYSSSPRTNPQGPSPDSIRVLRGGSWDYPLSYVRSAYRFWNAPGHRYNNCGFRLSFPEGSR